MVFGYSTTIQIEAAIIPQSNARLTAVNMEVLGVTYANAKASAVFLEVTSTIQRPAKVDYVFLECLCYLFVPVPYVPDAITPWTIRPDWASGITERLQWKTDVLTSETGVEQRRRLRNSPRRELDISFIVWRNQRRLFDALLSKTTDKAYHMPLWWDRFTLVSAATQGDNALQFNPAYGEFYPGCVIMILGATPFLFEMVIVHAIESSQLILANTLSHSWPVGTTVYPTKKSRIMGQEVQVTRNTADAFTVMPTFQVIEPNDFIPLYSETFDAPHLYLTPANMNDVTTVYRRLWAEFDNEVGISERRDPALQSFNVMQLEQSMFGRLQHYNFRQILYFLQGKIQPVLLSTMFQDMQYLDYATSRATDNYIFIRRCGLSEFLGHTTSGRKIVGIYMNDGSYFLNTLAASVVTEQDVEAVSFTAPLGRAFGPRDIKRISYVQYMRQDQDDIEIMHVTDTLGGSTCTTTFMSLSDASRGGTDPYTLDYFTGTYIKNADAPAIPITAPTPDPQPVTTTPGSPPIYYDNDRGEGDSNGDNGNTGDNGSSSDSEGEGGD